MPVDGDLAAELTLVIMRNKSVHASYKRGFPTARLPHNAESFAPVNNIGILPEDTSIVFFVLKKKDTKAVYFNSDGEGANTYRLMFNALKRYNLSSSLLAKILHLFDDTIDELVMIDDHNYELRTANKKKVISDNELVHYLSSGTTKGLLLYVTVIASLEYGFDLIIDEIENHFHKTLVENIINLYKDKSVNKHNATLYFSTHYCELLDLFNRQDNIWVCRADKKISAENMYENFNIRTELSKSRQFYNDAFKTAVNYEDLMNMYYTLHEADITKFVDIADEKIREHFKDTNLKRIRSSYGCTQAELAKRSGVTLRSIQMYEQRNKDINKASADALYRISKVLGCSMESLLEK